MIPFSRVHFIKQTVRRLVASKPITGIDDIGLLSDDESMVAKGK
jgi:hypothetical protein